MINKNLLPEKDRELIELAERFEAARSEQKSIYMDSEDLADLAEWYSRRNRFKDAADVIECGLKLHPDNTSLLVEKVYLYLDQFKLAEAKKTARLITEERPDVTILRARLLAEDGRLDEAELMLDTLEDKYCKENIIDVAYMYLETGQRQRALDWLKHWRWDTDNQEYCAIMADNLLDQQEYREALTYYNKLVDQNPYHPPYWIGVARCHLGLGEYAKAIDACDYALLADEDLGDAYLIKGYSFIELRNGEKALEAYEGAIRCHVITQAYVHLLMGQLYVDTKKWPEAFKLLQQAKREEKELKDPISRSTLYSALALCLKHADKEGNKQLIMKYCLKAIDLDYYNVTAQLLAGLIFIEEGEMQTGLSMWKEISELVPEASTWWELSSYSLEASLFDHAIEALKKVEALEPDYPNLYKRLAITCILAGKPEEGYRYNRKDPSPIDQRDLEDINQLVARTQKDKLNAMLNDYLKNTNSQKDQ